MYTYIRQKGQFLKSCNTIRDKNMHTQVEMNRNQDKQESAYSVEEPFRYWQYCALRDKTNKPKKKQLMKSNTDQRPTENPHDSNQRYRYRE